MTMKTGGSVSAQSQVSEEPLVHDYYDAIGEVTLARDYLYNLETDHAQDIYTRASQLDRGHKLEQSDEDFYKEYFKERTALVTAYVSGKSRVEQLFIECSRKQLPVEEPNLPPLLEDVLDQTIRVPRNYNRIANAAPNGTYNKDLYKKAHIQEERAAMRDKVALWLAYVPEGGVAAPPPSSEDDESQPRSYSHQRSNSDIKSDVLSAFQPEKPKRRYSDPQLQLEHVQDIERSRSHALRRISSLPRMES